MKIVTKLIISDHIKVSNNPILPLPKQLHLKEELCNST